MSPLSRAVLVVLSLTAPAATAHAQDAQPPRVSDDESWSFRLTPYMWFAGMNGDVGVNRNLPVVDVDLDFTEIFDHIDWWPPPVMLVGEARYKSFAIFTDFFFIGLEAGAQRARGPLAASVDLDVDNLVWTIGTSYRVLEDEGATLDLLAGGRLWNVDAKGTLVGPLAVRERSGARTWVDPIIGVNGRYDLGSGFAVQVEGDIGGFGLASDLDWQAIGTLQYAIGESTSLELGYRHLSVDYSTNSGFLFDTSLSGPIIGATFRF